VALVIDEPSLIEVCDLLGADLIEVVDSAVTFVKQLACGDRMRWTAELGDHLVSTYDGWRVTSELPAATTLAAVA
jgi:hypothetical protein